ASSPTTANGPMVPFFTAPVAARMPRAIGRSNEAPSLRMSAGARFTVILSTGKAKPALRIAVRTRSRLSRTAESGRPTVVTVGKPPHWTVGKPLRCRLCPHGRSARPRAPMSEQGIIRETSSTVGHRVTLAIESASYHSARPLYVIVRCTKKGGAQNLRYVPVTYGLDERRPLRVETRRAQARA